jgi:KipI family sensor histidine kinase inhibitor
VYDIPRFISLGEACLVVEFSDAIEMAANVRLRGLSRVMSGEKISGLLECVPTYRSLAIHYDPIKLPRRALVEIVRSKLAESGAEAESFGRIVVLPVAYGGRHGPDMSRVSAHSGLDEEEIVRRHTARDYYCHMLGFTPGFGYLGGMDDSLATPRLENPRAMILAGSVGIAGFQTGAYSVDGPGGWNLIGRTPLLLFNPLDEKNPTLIEAGDWVRFTRISDVEYGAIRRGVEAEYEPERLDPCGR